MRFSSWGVVVGLCVVSCGGGSDSAPPASAKGTGGAGDQIGGGDADPCGTTDPPKAVGWDEQTSFGASPAQAFASLAGTCTGSLSWDAASSDNLAVSPQAGSTDVTVTVNVDQSSARAVTPRPRGPLYCPQSLQVDAHVHIESREGTFVADAVAKARYEGTELVPITFSIPSTELGGSISIRPKSPDTTVRLSFTVSPIGDGCVGTVDLETSSPMPGGGFGGSGKFASWSDTGCSVGEKSVPLDAPSQDGAPSIAATVASAWSKASHTGTWDDGTTTDLTMAVGDLPATACRDAFTDMITFPVHVTYETADGRVKPHSESADLVVLGYGGAEPELELSTNETFRCESATSTLPYTPADCASLSRILIQLSLSESTRIGATSGGSITVYEYGKNADPNTDRADAVQTLSLSGP